MICPCCGAETIGKFCKFCGTSLTQENEIETKSTGTVVDVTSMGNAREYLRDGETGAPVQYTLANKITGYLFAGIIVFIVICMFVPPLGNKVVSLIRSIPISIEEDCSVWEVVSRQDAIIKYANEDTLKLQQISGELASCFDSISSGSDVEQVLADEEFASRLSDLANRQKEEAEAVAKVITDEELASVHKLYVDYTGEISDAVTLMLASVEDQDWEKMYQAQEKVDAANALADQYDTRFEILKERYGLQ